jgi:hypothetical protein
MGDLDQFEQKRTEVALADMRAVAGRRGNRGQRVEAHATGLSVGREAATDQSMSGSIKIYHLVETGVPEVQAGRARAVSETSSDEGGGAAGEGAAADVADAQPEMDQGGRKEGTGCKNAAARSKEELPTDLVVDVFLGGLLIELL